VLLELGKTQDAVLRVWSGTSFYCTACNEPIERKIVFCKCPTNEDFQKSFPILSGLFKFPEEISNDEEGTWNDIVAFIVKSGWCFHAGCLHNKKVRFLDRFFSFFQAVFCYECRGGDENPLANAKWKDNKPPDEGDGTCGLY